MSDVVDKANDLVDLRIDECLREHKENNKETRPYEEDEGILECDECGIEIPVARRKLTGSVLCVDCQKWEEDLKSRKGGKDFI